MSDDAEIAAAVWSLSAPSSPSSPSGYIHRVTLWPGGLGERAEPRSLELQLPWGLRVVILMREDVLSLPLPSALSQCLLLLSVPLPVPRQVRVGLWGEAGVGGDEGRHPL